MFFKKKKNIELLFNLNIDNMLINLIYIYLNYFFDLNNNKHILLNNEKLYQFLSRKFFETDLENRIGRNNLNKIKNNFSIIYNEQSFYEEINQTSHYLKIKANLNKENKEETLIPPFLNFNNYVFNSLANISHEQQLNLFNIKRFIEQNLLAIPFLNVKEFINLNLEHLQYFIALKQDLEIKQKPEDKKYIINGLKLKNYVLSNINEFYFEPKILKNKNVYNYLYNKDKLPNFTFEKEGAQEHLLFLTEENNFQFVEKHYNNPLEVIFLKEAISFLEKNDLQELKNTSLFKYLNQSNYILFEDEESFISYLMSFLLFNTNYFYLKSSLIEKKLDFYEELKINYDLKNELRTSQHIEKFMPEFKIFIQDIFNKIDFQQNLKLEEEQFNDFLYQLEKNEEYKHIFNVQQSEYLAISTEGLKIFYKIYHQYKKSSLQSLLENEQIKIDIKDNFNFYEKYKDLNFVNEKYLFEDFLLENFECNKSNDLITNMTQFCVFNYSFFDLRNNKKSFKKKNVFETMEQLNKNELIYLISYLIQFSYYNKLIFYKILTKLFSS